jgi:hypothetical protein
LLDVEVAVHESMSRISMLDADWSNTANCQGAAACAARVRALEVQGRRLIYSDEHAAVSREVRHQFFISTRHAQQLCRQLAVVALLVQCQSPGFQSLFPCNEYFGTDLTREMGAKLLSARSPSLQAREVSAIVHGMMIPLSTVVVSACRECRRTGQIFSEVFIA